MQLIIPLSGIGKRFSDAGYKEPKPLIKIDGKYMIEHVLNLFPEKNRDVIFICNEIHLKDNIVEILNSICKCQIKIISNDIRLGPVYAVSKIFDTELFDENSETIVSYCDYGTYWNYFKFISEMRNNNADGGIACYKGFHPHMLGIDNYAFVSENNLWLDAIQEKKPFTNNRMNEFASNGTYYFKTGKILKYYFNSLMNINEKINGEFYVSMVYNLMRKDGLKTRIYEIENMLQQGTPYASLRLYI